MKPRTAKKFKRKKAVVLTSERMNADVLFDRIGKGLMKEHGLTEEEVRTNLTDAVEKGKEAEDFLESCFKVNYPVDTAMNVIGAMIRDAAGQAFMFLPNSRDRSLAFTRLEEALFWFSRAFDLAEEAKEGSDNE